MAKEGSAKIVLLGANHVGKSALAVRYLTKRFITEYASHMDYIYFNLIELAGRKIDLTIIDFANKTSMDDVIRWADGIILVYSVTSRRSFQKIRSIMKVVRSVRGGQVRIPIVLCGNKTDMNHHRLVSAKEARAWAAEHRCIMYEVSAMDSAQTDAVTHMFARLTREILRHKAKKTDIFQTRRSTADTALLQKAKQSLFKRMQKKEIRRTSTL